MNESSLKNNIPENISIELDSQDREEINEQEWLQAAATNSAFDFLNDSQEDIYTLADGKPFHDQG